MQNKKMHFVHLAKKWKNENATHSLVDGNILEIKI